MDADYNHEPPNGVSNYLSFSAPVARRTSIEFCELIGVEYMMRSLVGFVEQVMAKTGRGEAEFGIKIISVSVDSRSVLTWIGDGSVTYKFEEYVPTTICSITS